MNNQNISFLKHNVPQKWRTSSWTSRNPESVYMLRGFFSLSLDFLFFGKKTNYNNFKINVSLLSCCLPCWVLFPSFFLFASLTSHLIVWSFYLIELNSRSVAWCVEIIGAHHITCTYVCFHASFFKSSHVVSVKKINQKQPTTIS